ncbi:MAG: universal stress protein [Planctomycetes bacterium]|nr:universal stress protein [Planctomycetota bacterium]
MFKRILIPLDFTDKNLRALEVARELAIQDKASVALLHVIETVEHVPFGELKGFYKKLEDEARARMALPSSLFLEKDLVVDPEIVYGKRAEEIVRYAMANQVDLIVLSSHKIGPEQAARGWPTISYKVAVLAQCPVLLVK